MVVQGARSFQKLIPEYRLKFINWLKLNIILKPFAKFAHPREFHQPLRRLASSSAFLSNSV
jgi:hypothetical protein